MVRLIRRLAGLDGRTLADLARAGCELAIARLRLNSRQFQALMTASPVRPQTLDRHQVALVDRVAFAVPRVAANLPWRADCIVQALAAKRWLRRAGITANFNLGVPKGRAQSFEAHAWLTVGGRIVTGGDIAGYIPLQR